MFVGAFDSLFPRGYWLELKTICQLGSLMALTQALQWLTSSISLMFCRRLNKTEFAGVALALVMIGTFGTALVIGLSTACDTLFAQVYGNANKRHKLGMVLIRSLILITPCAFLPITLYLNAENILIGLHQPREVSRLAARYLFIISPGLIGLFFYMPLSKYLQNQNIILPTLIIGLLANIINVILNLILVVKAGYGLIGSAISLTSCYLSYPILTLIYIWISKVYQETWTGWTTECLLNWSQFLHFGWFGSAMTCIEWWSYEISELISGYIGETELASQSIIMQIGMYCWLVFLGLSLAGGIRIGHLLGANDPEGASDSCKVLLTVTWFVSGITFVFVYTLKSFLPMIFTNITEIVSMTSSGLGWYAISCLFEGSFLVCGGILRGSGRQKIGSVVTTTSQCIGFSIGVSLMIRYRTVEAFWQGFLIGVAIEAILLCTICLRTDWKKEALRVLDSVDVATEEVMVVPSDKTSLLDKMPPGITSWTYIRTTLAALFVSGILIMGILVRIYVPVKDSQMTVENITYRYNTTYTL